MPKTTLSVLSVVTSTICTLRSRNCVSKSATMVSTLLAKYLTARATEVSLAWSENADFPRKLTETGLTSVIAKEVCTIHRKPGQALHYTLAGLDRLKGVYKCNEIVGVAHGL